jgi:zinc transporter, ZIP family
VGEALIIGVIGSSALVLGGMLGAWWPAPARVTGVLLAFASGALVAALAFELFPDAVETGGLGPASAGLLGGALTFVVVNTVVDSRVAAGAGDTSDVPLPDAASEAVSGAQADQREKLAVAAQAAPAGPTLGVAFGLLAAVTLDGVPENLALGVSLGGGEGELTEVIALLVAIFVSNLPESLVGAVAMRSGGQSRRFVIVIWTITAVILTAAVVLGEGLASSLSAGALAFALSFAGGAVLASLADTLMPEAFEHGRPLNAFSTALGFLLAFVLADL